MQKITFFIILAVTVFICTPTYAWKVTLKNEIPTNSSYQSYQSISCDVYGEHFFWRDKVDCTISNVTRGNSASCDVGPGICPVALVCTIVLEGKKFPTRWYYMGARCWDVIVEYQVKGNGVTSVIDGVATPMP